MTEEKRKRGRPKKVKPDEGNAHKIQSFAPIYPSDTPVNDPVSLEFVPGTRVDYDNPPPDEFHPSKMEAVVSIMEDVALAKKHIERLKNKPEYSPYDNPRFKSKNNLK